MGIWMFLTIRVTEKYPCLLSSDDSTETFRVPDKKTGNIIEKTYKPKLNKLHLLSTVRINICNIQYL